MDNPITDIALALGLNPSTVVMTIVTISAIANVLGRMIPDDAIGWKGALRKAAKLVGLYTSNRITSGVSVNDTARAIAGVPEKKDSTDGVR